MVYGKRPYRTTNSGRYRKPRVYKTKATPFKRVNTRSLVVKKKTNELVKLIKGVTLKQAETCYRSVSRPLANLYHDTLRVVPIWTNSDTSIFPPQGNSDGDRRGDEIIAQGIRMRMVIQIPFDRRNTILKMWYLPMNSAQGDPTNYGNFFHNVSGNSQLDPVQTDHWKGIRYLGLFKARSVDQNLTEVGNNKTILVNRWIPMKKRLCFINDGSTVPGNIKEEGFIVIAPYDSISTSTLDIVVTNIETTFTLYYKDP